MVSFKASQTLIVLALVSHSAGAGFGVWMGWRCRGIGSDEVDKAGLQPLWTKMFSKESQGGS